MLKQIIAVTLMNFKALKGRFWPSLVIVVGMACVVGVMLSMMSMAAGFVTSTTSAGDMDHAYVFSTNAQNETQSNLPRTNFAIVADAPAVAKDTAGKPLADPEILINVPMVRKADGLDSGMLLRGVGPQGLALRPQMKIVEGHMFRPGARELIVGRAAQGQFIGTKIGDQVTLPDGQWPIVGIFTSGGDFLEGQFFGDLDTVMTANKKTTYNAVLVKLTAPSAYETFRRAITTNPALQTSVERQLSYYQRTTGQNASVINIIAYVIGAVMAIGAMFGALNTMYAAVGARTREIATLRAIGFGSTAVVISVISEALLLALTGALIGAAIAWALFDGNQKALGANVFNLTVSPQLVLIGVIWALVVGLIGGLFPSIRAARLPVAHSNQSDMSDKSGLDALKINRSHAGPPRRWPWVVLAIFLVLGAGGAAAYKFWPADGVPIHVAAAQSDAASASSALDASGYVVARRTATLSPKIAGKLVEGNLEEGERVTVGQIVARLDDSNTRAALNVALAQEKMAEAALANAAPTYERYKKLNAEGATTMDALQNYKTLYDSARMSLDVARTGVAQAEINQNDTVVHAPFSGIVTAKTAQAGDFVAPSAGGSGGALTGIATIVDMDSLEVEVDVSENYIDRVVAGQKATITLNAYPDWEIPASVIAVIPTADQSKGTVKVRIAIEAKDKRILPQMGARVSFLSDSKAQEAPVSHGVLIPQVALQGVGDNASVFLVKDDSTIEVRAVSPGAKNGANIAIRGGLQPGDRVAIDNFDKLSDGTKVAVQQ